MLTLQNDPLQKLIIQLARLPGIGERSASRLAHYIAKHSCEHSNTQDSLADDLAQALLQLSQQTKLCERCENLTSTVLCHLCQDPKRNSKIICVVEGIADLRAIEQAACFQGCYHVLHGVLMPLEGIGPEQIKIRSLLQRLQQTNVEEVIVATSNNVEGDATALYIAKLLQPMQILVTRPASGMPLGAALEYIDYGTMERALLARQKVLNFRHSP